MTGHDRLRSARQRLAAGKLKNWSAGYLEGEAGRERKGQVLERGQSFVDRHLKLLVFLVVAVIVALQLVLLFSAVYA